jgi:hypothetical protein
MSMKSEIRRLLGRSGLAMGDLPALQRAVDDLVALVESNAALLRDIHGGSATSSQVDIGREFDSLATAHAEAMVYLNRSLREIRSEILAISAAVRELQADATSAARE